MECHSRPSLKKYASGNCPCLSEFRCEQPEGLADSYLPMVAFVAFLSCKGKGNVSCHPMKLYFILIGCFKEERIYICFFGFAHFHDWMLYDWMSKDSLNKYAGTCHERVVSESCKDNFPFLYRKENC